jgi:hypothetical protein
VTADDVAALLIGIGEGVNHLPGATDPDERRRLAERYVSILADGLRPPGAGGVPGTGRIGSRIRTGT